MFPFRITFVDCDNSPAVREKIEGHLAKLHRLHDRITDCEVQIRIPHKSRGPRYFHVHLKVDIPGKTLVVSRDSEPEETGMDIQKAIRDSFDKMTRQLEDYVHKR